MQETSPSPALRQRLRQGRDRLATGLITAGGIGVLLAIMAIGVFLISEVIPLLWSSTVDLRSLFLPSSYGVLETASYRWQPTLSVNDGLSTNVPLSQLLSQPRYSLVPLIWGTLEAALWSLVIAIPLALGAAIHSSLYMSQRLRASLRPTLELMEAMPGVVIGFVAGLVLAPWLDQHLAIGLALALLLPVGLLAGAGLRACLPAAWRRVLPIRWAALWLVPWVLLLVVAAVWLAPLLEVWWFNGDLRGWIDTSLGVNLQSRNALIIGLAMGFAVIPGIYALTEDALSGVPRSLVDGAQALGATRWQALCKVVLPAAGPGVVSAVMIGAGRAVGETMIVLMASGNMAIVTANPLDGLRTLAASIAIELPEAAPGGDHFRLLMLAALLLFVFTFLVNTVAEVIRHRLYRRYLGLGGAS